ncbi:MAG: hypothetical protein RXQ94_09225 [Caldivirga sp.]
MSSSPKETLRSFIVDLIDTLGGDVPAIKAAENIIIAYIDFYLNMITDEQALKILVSLDQVCKLAKKHTRGVKHVDGD